MSAVDVEQLQPISRTYQYRKVMKPMLERKRRARINRCLDELKEFILSTLQAEGENVSKLEKADILEFTVQHLYKLRRLNQQQPNSTSLPAAPTPSPVSDNDRFRAGFTHCASEVSRCLALAPHVDVNLGKKLMTHLGYRLKEMENTTPLSVRVAENYSPVPPSSPSSISSEGSYTMPLTPTSVCSRNSSPCHAETQHQLQYQPATTFGSNGLLSVVDMSTKCSPAPVWRPW
ncbi:hypothetical protein V9T40_011511 [Parthenolecanium corni]|uniref:Uncharacterized protein n=1 Tax=Parthenolecanium corni TaxID=536013 RepID=A0AAN9T667_9HEMI